MVILQTEHLLFRPHEPRDCDEYCDMEADPDVRRFVGGEPRQRDKAEERFYNGLNAPIANRLALWATDYKPEGRYIGRCGIYPHFDTNGNAILGEGTLAFYLARPYWGLGLATEAGRAFLHFGFTKLLLNRIVATVQVGNVASVRVMEKLGIRHVDTELGEVRSFLHYEMRSDEWPKHNGVDDDS